MLEKSSLSILWTNDNILTAEKIYWGKPLTALLKRGEKLLTI